MNKHITKKRQISTWSVCAIGAAISIVLSIAGAAITGSLMLNETIGQQTSGAVTKVLLFISVLAGVLIALNISDCPVFTVTAVISGSVIMLQLLICAFLYDGIKGSTFLNAAVILAAAAVSIVIKLKKRSGSATRKRRYR